MDADDANGRTVASPGHAAPPTTSGLDSTNGDAAQQLPASTDAASNLIEGLSEQSLTFGLSGSHRPQVDHLPGLVLGDVRIERLIAEGGMGRVYLGRQQRPARPVAVKFMRHGRSAASLERFCQEAEVLGRLSHPGIARVFSAGSVRIGLDEVPYSVMEYIPDAEPLVDFCEQRQLPVEPRLRLFLQVCDAVAYGHSQGVVHRDLKPGNILVTLEGGSPNGRACVIDFGIAKLLADETDASVTSTGEFLGTRRYMSPEQLSGGRIRIDARTDVYALGVILHELLTGQLPYDIDGRSIEATARIVSQCRPRPLDMAGRTASPLLRQGVRRIAERCLRKSPLERYPTASAVADDVRRLLAGLAVPRHGGRQRMAVGMAAAAFLGVAAVWFAFRPTAVNQSPDDAVNRGSPLMVELTNTKSKRSTPMDWILLPFKSSVDSLDLSAVSLTRNGVPVDLSGCKLTRETDNAWRLSGLAACNTREGDYVFTLHADRGVQDELGRRLAEDSSVRWTMPPYRSWEMTPLDDSWEPYLVSIDGLERYTEQDAGADSFFRPIVAGVEGSIVFRFEAPFVIDTAEVRAHMMVWTTGDPFPYDPGAKASLDVSPDGAAWTTIAVREAGNGGGMIAAIDISDTVRGSREVWVRGRLEATVEWPGDGLIHAQFLRTNASHERPPFSLQVAAAHAAGPGADQTLPTLPEFP